MTKTSQSQFTEQYHAALRIHLSQQPRGRLPSSSARSLGRTAVSLGLVALDLARVHGRAVMAVQTEPQSIANSQNPNSPLTRAEAFFIEALKPIEQAQKAAQKALPDVVHQAHPRFETVRIHKSSGPVRLDVRDGGKPFQAERILTSNTNRRRQLTGMRERAGRVGRPFAIKSAPDKGTRAHAVIPFRNKRLGGNT